MADLENPLRSAAPATEGNDTRLRSEVTRGLVTQSAHGAYYEETNQGSTWTISTATAGIISTTLMVVSVASAIPIVGVFNPSNSGVNLSLQKMRLICVTGTGTSFVWGVAAAPAMTTTDGVTTAKNNKTFVAGGHKARAFAGATAMVGTALPFRILGGPVAGVAAVAGVGSTFTDAVDGEIVVAPGAFAGVFCDVAVTANLVKASLSWAEIPIPSP